MTEVREALAQGVAAGVPRNEAEILLAHVLDADRAWLYAHARDPLAAGPLAQFCAVVERRARGEPVAYITGRRGFWTLDLEVTSATLIPRAETELLVELALERLPPEEPAIVADLGTGSGAVALAVASERPRARVLATDRSGDALAVAQRNAARLRLDSVAFALGDWCEALDDARFDLILANPPYIAAADPHLARGDLRHEPAMALVSGSDGLDAIRCIVRDAAAHLRCGGWLLFEHGRDQGADARSLLEQAGYVDVFTAPDLEQRDRVSGGRVA